MENFMNSETLASMLQPIAELNISWSFTCNAVATTLANSSRI